MKTGVTGSVRTTQNFFWFTAKKIYQQRYAINYSPSEVRYANGAAEVTFFDLSELWEDVSSKVYLTCSAPKLPT